ncbi:YhjD/YihY/BrkB family envelope integrity protein [Pseudonocardia xishanensis]|uniref:YihY/virulence factor BrkB family protein n=1 Tax=Pseudonocardia xishanensis TaxID=630995 RepID=A0ABP8RJ84_9PSEU
MTPRLPDRLVVRVLRRMTAIDGYDRALAPASQAFVALVPAALVLSVSEQGSGGALASGLGFSREAASTLTDLVDPIATEPSLTVVGWLLLVVSVLGFVRSLQRAYSAAWGLASTGLRGYGRGLLASATLVAELGVLILLAPVLGWLLGSPVVALGVYAATGLALWWPIQYVLLRGRVRWRALLPGALLTGVGQALLVAASGLVVPIATARSVDRLGLLGVATVLLSWLVVLGVLLVLSAVVGSELAQPALAPGDVDHRARGPVGSRGEHDAERRDDGRVDPEPDPAGPPHPAAGER